MATIGNEPNGRRRILFVAPDGSRKSVGLGKCDKKSAESIKLMVEFLVSAKALGKPIPLEVAAWVNGIGTALKTKLEKCALLECQSQEGGKTSTLKVFLETHVLNRKDVKPASLTVWSQTCRNLLEYFGDGRELASITAGDALAFKEWLVASPNKRDRAAIRLAPATVAKRLKLSRQFFERAVDLELIPQNPFKKVKSPGESYSHEKTFITRETMGMLMRVSNPAWQGILALARYGGLRNPSETLSLKWSQVHWDKNQILVPSCKTEHHPGKGFRVIPMFPELVEPLRLLNELAPSGAEYVIPGDWRKKAIGPRGWQNINLRKAFDRLCTVAGLALIREPFKAMRATRATELSESWPMKTVASWMGHDVKILLRHYAQIPQEHFERAIVTTVSGGTESGTVVAHFPVQNPYSRGTFTRTEPVQQVAAGNGQDNEYLVVNPETGSLFASSCLTQPLGAKGLSGPEGI